MVMRPETAVHSGAVLVRARTASENGVIGMGLDMLLEILRALEGLATEVTLVRLQRHMNTDMRGDVVTLDSGSPARIPHARQVKVVGALATDMLVADMVLIFMSAPFHSYFHFESTW